MVKQLNKSDANSIYEIELESFDKSQQYKNIEELFDNKNYQIFGVFEDQMLISYAIGVSYQDEYELYKIATKSSYQNKGYATEIINYILTKYKKIFLEVSSRNITAYNFYKNLGFKLINVRKKYYSDLSDALILEKK